MFNIVNRTIVPNNISDIVVQGDNDSRNIKYRIQKNFESTDLSTKSISIRYTTPDGKSDESFATNLITEMEFITFEWKIGAGVTVQSGIVTYDILFYDNNGYKWHTKPATLNIEKGLNITTIKPQPTTDWIDSWRTEAGQFLTNCRRAEIIAQQAIEDVKDIDTTKRIVMQKSSEAAYSAEAAKVEADRAKTEADKIGSIVSFSGEYKDLTGKPLINGVELENGNNTCSALGIQPAGNYVTLLEQNVLSNRILSIENSFMPKTVYDSENRGYVNRSKISDNSLSTESVEWTSVKNKPEKYTPDAHIHSDYQQQISNVESSLATLNATIRKSIPLSDVSDTAVTHRNSFRGKNLGNSVTLAQRAAIQNGSFDDLWLGDYWVIGGKIWRIADFNYWYNCGDVPFITPHLVIMPDVSLYEAGMNEKNITTGGYVGSKMYTEGLAQAKTMIASAFPGIVLSHRELLVNAVANGYPTAGAWYDSTVELPNEIMMYGSHVFAPAGNGTTTTYLQTINNSQLALMAAYPRFIKIRESYWLRDAVSASSFASVGLPGYANYNGASLSFGVRPVFAIG